jgi:hypothetical protein
MQYLIEQGFREIFPQGYFRLSGVGDSGLYVGVHIGQGCSQTEITVFGNKAWLRTDAVTCAVMSGSDMGLVFLFEYGSVSYTYVASQDPAQIEANDAECRRAFLEALDKVMNLALERCKIGDLVFGPRSGWEERVRS